MEPELRLQATVHRNVDVLEWEHSHGRLDEAAYLVGRQLKRAYERLPAAACTSNWQGGDRVDGASAQGVIIERMHAAARHVHVIERRAAQVIGQAGVTFLALILRDGMTFADIAARDPHASRATTTRVADRFRWLLAQLATGWAARGRR